MPRDYVYTVGQSSALGVPTDVAVRSMFGVHVFELGKVIVSATPTGSPATTYRVTSSPGGIVAYNAEPSVSVYGLKGGQAYTFTMAASHDNGSTWTAESAPSAPFTPQTSPGSVVLGDVTAGNGQVTVNFTGPADNGGESVDS